MKFECPKCYKENELYGGAAICCDHCETSVKDVTFRQIKFITFGTVLTFVTGGILFDKAEAYIGGERLPISVEFEIVQSCLESDKRYLKKSIYKAKKQACTCGLDLVLKELDYDDLKESAPKFIAEYSKKVKECK